MDTTYRLSQTGKEVQALLDQVTPNEQAIAQEQQRAQAAEQQLQDNIDAIGQGGSAAVTAERERAMAAESALDAKIDAETTRATDAEGTLTDAINKEVTDRTEAVTAEATARQQADTAEATARADADATLDAKIEAETTRAKAAESTLTDAIDKEVTDRTEAVTAEATARQQADTDEATARADADATLDAKIDTETTRAKAAEGTLTDAINKEVTDRTNAVSAEATARQQADTAQQQALAQETARAQQAELTNAQAISTEAQARTAADTTILDNLQAEARTRLSADTDLQEHIDDEETRAKAAEKQLQDNIDAIGQSGGAAVAAETARAKAAESMLDAKIEAETTRAEAADGTLTDAIDKEVTDRTEAVTAEATARQQADNAEATARQQADTTLQGNIDTEATARADADAALDAKIDAETTRAEAAEGTLTDAIDKEVTDRTEAVTAEATARQQADTTLQGNIDTEATARADADAALDAKIDAETTRAEAAEGTLTDAIDKEVTDRTEAVTAEATARQQADNAEATARQQADTTLQGNIDTEATARADADAALDAKIDAETTRAEAAEGTLTDTIDKEVTDRTEAVTAESTARQQADTAEATARQQADTTLQDNIDTEAAARAAADVALDNAKQDKLTFDEAPLANSQNPVKSQGIRSAIDTAVLAEETRAKAAEQVNALGVSDLKSVVPTQASPTNQLADKEFVNSSIASSTGKFLGNYNLITDLHLTTTATTAETAAALLTAISQASNNDYCFVQVPSSDATPDQIKSIDRYKFDGTKWQYEYSINNSSFTAAELAAIQSGITAPLVQKLDALYTKAQLDVLFDSKQSVLTFDQQPIQGSVNPVTSNGIHAADAAESEARATADTALDGKITAEKNRAEAAEGELSDAIDTKQDTIADLADIRAGAAAGSTAYQKPQTGIPATDLSEGVQDSLGKADTALQEHQSLADYATKQEVTTAVAAESEARATADTALDGKITAEKNRAEAAEGELSDAIDTKQDTIADLADIRAGAAAGSTAYQKPQTGIPATDLSEGVQDSLGKADTALQEHQSLADYATKQEVTTAVNAEATRAQQAETTISDNLSQESTARATADADLQAEVGLRNVTIETDAEPDEQTLTYTIRGTQRNHIVGDKRVYIDTGGVRTLYFLVGIVSGEAQWQQGGGGGDVTGRIRVNLEAYVNGDKTAGADLAGLEVTLTNTTDQTTVGTQQWQGTQLVFSGLTPLKDYQVSVAAKQGYTQPAPQTVQQLGISDDVTRTFRYEADQYTAIIQSNQPDTTDLQSATITLTAGQQQAVLADGQTVLVPAGTEVSATASDVAGYAQSVTIVGKTVTALYQTTLISVNMAGENAGVEGSAPTGAQATVSYQGGTDQVLTDNTQTAKVPTGTAFTVTYAPVSGYATPATYSATATGASMTAPKATYIFGVLRLTVTMSDSDATVLADVQPMIAINGGAAAAMTGSAGVFTANMEVGDTYTITFNSLVADGYQTPAAISGTFQGGVQTETAQYLTTILTLGSIVTTKDGNVQGQNPQGAGVTVAYTGQTAPATLTAINDSVKVPANLTPTITPLAVQYYAASATLTGGSISVTYATVSRTVSITSNQTSDSVIAAVAATLTYTYEGETVTRTDIADGTEVLIPATATAIAFTAPDMTGYAKTISGAAISYATTILTVTLTSDTGEADLSGVTKTVTDTTLSTTVNPQQDGTYKIPTGHGYSVSVSDDVEGYKAPDAATGTASGTSATVTMTYEEQAGFVDLGLPSGLKWAQGNLVKDSQGNYSIGEETDWGTYVSWGNIIGHNEGDGYDFSDANYNSTPGHSVAANIPSNDAAHDIALATLGTPWHLPTKEDFQELYDNTDSERVADYNGTGVAGRKFMKKSDHSVYVFFPASGLYYGTSLNIRGSSGLYWSSSFYSATRAYYLSFNSSSVTPQNISSRRSGYSVRPVQ